MNGNAIPSRSLTSRLLATCRLNAVTTVVNSDLEANHAIGLLQAALAPAMESRGGLSGMQQMHRPRLVSDHAEKFLLFNNSLRRSAVVALSPGSHPRKEREAAVKALASQEVLGERLATAVLAPWHVDQVDGVWYSITDHVAPLSNWRVKRWWQAYGLRGPLLQWLLQATVQSARLPTDAQRTSEFLMPLAAAIENPRLTAEIKKSADAAMAALECGRWRPRLVLAHNDLWVGNVLLAPRSGSDGWGFAIIDWSGSRTSGHAIYDLIRLSMSLGISARSAGDQVALHAKALGCRIEETQYYLSAALGYLAANLGEWPEARFVEVAMQCHRRLAACMPR